MTALEEVIEKSVRLAANTRRNYLTSVRDFLAFAGTDPVNWTGPTVELWRDAMRQSKKATTVNSALKALSYAAQRLEDRGEGRNFVTYAEKLLERGEAATPSPCTLEEARLIVLACAGAKPADLRDHAIVVTGFRTGLRRHELLQLGWETVYITPQGTGAVRVTLKGGRTHEAALDLETWNALRPWTTWLAHTAGIRTGPYFRSIGRKRPDGNYPVGKGLTDDGLYKIVRARAEIAGVNDFHPHRFRHSFISWKRAQGDSYEAVRQATGQKSTGTVDHYAQPVGPLGKTLPSLTEKG